MADCSELGKLLNQLAMNIGADPSIKGIDGILAEIQKDIPEMRRVDIVNAINESTQGQNQNASDLKRELSDIQKEIAARKKNQAELRQEARLDRDLNKEIGQLNQYLETGVAPPKTPKPPAKEQTLAIQHLQKTRDNLTKWVKTSDPVMKDKLGQKLGDLKSKIESGELEINEANAGKLHDEIQKIQDEIDAAKSQIQDERRLGQWQEKIDALGKHLDEGTLPKVERRVFDDPESIVQAKSMVADLRSQLKKTEPAQQQRIQKQIDQLNRYLDEGTAPEGRKPAEPASDKIQSLIEIRDDLKKRLAQSDPVQKKREEKQIATLEQKIAGLKKNLEEGTLPPKTEARQFEDTETVSRMKNVVGLLRKYLRNSEPALREKLEKRIAKLDERIESGDIYPKTKPAPVPMSQELRRLEYIANQKAKLIREKLYAEKPKTMLDWIADPFNAARTIIAGGDLSFVLRQGKFIGIANPARVLKSIPAMVKAVGSRRAEFDIQSEIESRHYGPMYAKGKLYFSPTESGTALSKMDEAYQSHWINRIPIISGTQRGNVAFLNKLRADSFDAMASTMAKDGEITIQQAEDIARFINEATGRGGLGAAEGAAVHLGLAFFSPRYQVSRLQLLVGHPIWAAKDPAARKLIVKEYAKTVIGYSVALGLALAAGANIETDRKSPDFLTLRWGRERIDILAGLKQPFVFVNRLLSGKKTNPVTGKQSDLEARDIFQFQRSKASPLAGTLTDVALRKDYKGDPVTPGSVARNLVTPITLGEIANQIKEYGLGPRSIAGSLLSFLGESVNIYDEDQKPVDPEVEKFKEKLSDIRSKIKREEPVSKEERDSVKLWETYDTIVAAYQKKANEAKTKEERKAAYDKIKQVIKKIESHGEKTK